TSPNSALVVSNPSSLAAPPAGSSPFPRLVDSISREVSGSAVTGSTRLSEIGAGSRGGGEGRGAAFGGGGTGFETGAPRPAPTPGRSLTVGGESTSRNTRLDVLRLPDFERSGAPDAGGLALGAGAGALATERRSGAPYMRRCSSKVSRRCAPSGERSASSFNAAKACWIFPALCIRSAYSAQ